MATTINVHGIEQSTVTVTNLSEAARPLFTMNVHTANGDDLTLYFHSQSAMILWADGLSLAAQNVGYYAHGGTFTIAVPQPLHR